MRTLRTLLIGIARSAIWPAYLALGAYAAHQAPWPKVIAQPTSAVLLALAAAALAANIIRRVFEEKGCADDVLRMPRAVSCQVGNALVVLVIAHVVFLLPVALLTQGLIAPGGRPVTAPAVVRGLILGFETSVLLIVCWALRRHSPLVAWVAESPASLGRLARQRRQVSALVVAGIVAVIVLDARGFCFSARRLASGAAGSLIVAVVSWGFYRVLLRFIDDHVWDWFKLGGHAFSGRVEPAEDCGMPDDLAGRLRQLSVYFATGVGLLMGAWVWDIDLALFRFISEQNLWPDGSVVEGKEVFVTVGDLTKTFVELTIAAMAWRYMSTFFAVVVFPRIPDDPGIRFAMVTLCRYAVLGVGLLCGLASIHLGLEKIGMVLAALGVGLGFGLQEIVSNFVCGIILLLERPIRVGDIVTVSAQTGKVDRINIRATTIMNGDNQSIIIPNRAFITGDLINWTLKDKVVRVSVRVKVSYGIDPDTVADLLLAIAHDDPDVLRTPAPSALMEEISESALSFGLSAYVPDPSLAGRAKHRLFRQIQERFRDAKIPIPLPIHELVVKPYEVLTNNPSTPPTTPFRAGRVDPPSATPYGLRASTLRNSPETVEDARRGMDE